jgi:AcrR family transcriptional regulator
MSLKLGKRIGQQDTRSDILKAARCLFSEVGYDRATIRSVAVEANVDPSLVIHFFKTKEELFVAAISQIFDVTQNLAEALVGDRFAIGRRLATFFIAVMENSERGPIVIGLIRAAASEQRAAAILKEGSMQSILKILQLYGHGDDMALKANLIDAHMIGVAVERYIVKVEPLASAPAEAVIAHMARALQVYFDTNETKKEGT